MEIKEIRFEDMTAIKECMEFMRNQGLIEQPQHIEDVLQYVGDMQQQLVIMVNELQGMREQLSQLQENQTKSISEKVLGNIDNIQTKIKDLSEKLSIAKEQLIDMVVQSTNLFKEKGVEKLNQFLQQSISNLKSMLAYCREQAVEILTDYEKTANQIDSIGDELKQIGNSVANVGRLMAGKGTKEINDELPGVAITRIINTPVKDAIDNLHNHITGIDNVCKKLDNISERMNKRIEVGKSDKVSMKQKISQMKVKLEQGEKTDKLKQAKKEQCL